MHTIEPYFKWRDHYIASEDVKSPFFGRVYSEFEFQNSIYNYYIHPQWDEFGSETLYLKILFVDYHLGFTIIELIGEWNDTLYNDIMFFKRNVIDDLISKGINKFILIGENVLNFHSSDDLYYEEWYQDIDEGWIVAIDFQSHVVQGFLDEGIDMYIHFNHENDFVNWRTQHPIKLYKMIDDRFLRRLSNL